MSTDPHALDDLDRRLLALLTDDARRPLAGLAAALGVARSTVQARLARLEQRGVIVGYTVRLGPGAPGAVRAHVALAVDGRRIDAVVEALVAMDEVRRIWTTNGDTDLAVEVACATPAALDHRIDRIAEVPGVRATRTTVLLTTRLDRA